MPRKIANVHKKVGEIHVKTAWDKFLEFVGGVIVIIVILGILVAIF